VFFPSKEDCECRHSASLLASGVARAMPDKTPDTGSEKKQKKIFTAETQRSQREKTYYLSGDGDE